VQDVARLLVAMGASIEGIGSNTYFIEGGRPLQGATYDIGPDHIEIGSFIGLAAVTNGAITIDGVRGEDLRSMLVGFDRLGVRPRLDGTRLHVDANQERRIRPDLGDHIPKLEDGPWPAFPADVMSIALVTATQCEGLLLIFEKMFESPLRNGRCARINPTAPFPDPHPWAARSSRRHTGRHGHPARRARGRG
jgi:UDP-N-acetylglucosamine 1-carboxyvinyltransferase